MAGSGEKDAKAEGTERTTERRLVASALLQSAQTAADSTRDVASEDFLFHLYRGSELLQDNRVLEAKEELEHALTLQPRDPKGQDLLAVVYFRIGLYPRAIQIYEQLKRDNPRDPSLKLNLALCYLKTGQAQAARAELEDVVRLHPSHKRAWGYLGLAHERLGDLAKAMSAFERAGHAQMARRVSEKITATSRDKPVARTATMQAPANDADLRGAAAAAFEELDAGELRFSLAEPVTGTDTAGAWKTTEPGAAQAPHREGWTVPPTAEAVASMRAEEIAARSGDTQLPGAQPAAATEAHPPSVARVPQQSVPMPLAHLARAVKLVFPASAGVLLHPSGVALVRTTGGPDATARSFAARLESIRVHAGALATEVLPRQTRGKGTGESFGGVASPLVRLAGGGEIMIAPRPSHAIVAFTIADDTVTVREDLLLGFEMTLTYENGKLALGDGDSAQVVQLRGTGATLLELLERVTSLDLVEGHPILVRRDSLVGWTGRVAPRAVPPVDAPGGQRGLLSIAGEGSVLLTSS